MKQGLRHIATGFVLILSLMFISPVMADEPPPPPPHGTGGDWQPGGSAPIGSGTIFLVVMGAFYGLKQAYDRRRRLIE
jgi:hypothetical protein